MLLAIVVYKDTGDLPYEGIRSWQIKGNWLILTHSRHEHILIPQDSFTSVEIREDRDYETEKEERDEIFQGLGRE